MQQNEIFETVKRIPRIAKKIYTENMSGFCRHEIKDTDKICYVMDFEMYNYFSIWLKYEKDYFRWIIKLGDREIYLSESFKIECDEDYDISLKALDEEIRLRLPGKLLSSGGWKEKKEEEIVGRKRRHNLDEKLKT